MLALVVYYVATRGVFQGKASGDGLFGFQYLRSIVFFHTLDMKQALPEYVPFFGYSGPGHHMPNRCPFGPVFVVDAVLPGRRAPFTGCAAGAQAVGGGLRRRRSSSIGSPGSSTLARRARRLALHLRARRAARRARRRAHRLDGRRVGDADRLVRGDAAVVSARARVLPRGGAARILGSRPAATRRGGACVRLGVVGGVAHDDARAGGAVAAAAGRRVRVARRRGPERRRWLVGGVVLSAATLLAFAPQMLVWMYYTGRRSRRRRSSRCAGRRRSSSCRCSRRAAGCSRGRRWRTRRSLGLFYSRARARAWRWRSSPCSRSRSTWCASAWVVTGGYGYGARRLSDGAPLMALGVGASVGALRGRARAVAAPARRRVRRALRAAQRRDDGAAARAA